MNTTITQPCRLAIDATIYRTGSTYTVDLIATFDGRTVARRNRVSLGRTIEREGFAQQVARELPADVDGLQLAMGQLDALHEQQSRAIAKSEVAGRSFEELGRMVSNAPSEWLRDAAMREIQHRKEQPND